MPVTQPQQDLSAAASVGGYGPIYFLNFETIHSSFSLTVTFPHIPPHLIFGVSSANFIHTLFSSAPVSRSSHSLHFLFSGLFILPSLFCFLPFFTQRLFRCLDCHYVTLVTYHGKIFPYSHSKGIFESRTRSLKEFILLGFQSTKNGEHH